MTSPLDRLRELEPKAAPGPWFVSANGYIYRGRWFGLIAKVVDDQHEEAAVLTESRNALPNLLTLEALARDEHDKRCTCRGENCKLGEVLRALDGEDDETEAEPRPSDGQDDDYDAHFPRG